MNGSTKVLGQGLVKWKVEDMAGVKRNIEIRAYFVPEASIRLFSPQAYIGNHPTSLLCLDKEGARLLLYCGTLLRFPLNTGNNIPFMLTEATLNHRRATSYSSPCPVHHPLPSPIGVTNIASTNLVDQHCVLSDQNRNLDPHQKELLSWHCCWGHCGMTQCWQILSHPQQTKQAATDGVHRSQMIIPVNPKTSSCPTFYCTACLYAKQHCCTPDLQSHVD